MRHQVENNTTLDIHNSGVRRMQELFSKEHKLWPITMTNRGSILSTRCCKSEPQNGDNTFFNTKIRSKENTSYYQGVTCSIVRHIGFLCNYNNEILGGNAH